MDEITIVIEENIDDVNITVEDNSDDISIQVVEAHDGLDGKTIVSAEFIGNDIVFTNNDASEVVLTDAKIELKGDTGATGRTGATGNPRGSGGSG